MTDLDILKSELRNLEAALTNAQTNRSNAKAQRDMAKDRRKEVKKIKDDLDGDFDNNCRSINSAADNMEGDISSGLKGIKNASTLDANIGADKEIKPEYEGNLSRAIQELEAEYNDLDRYYEEQKQQYNNLGNTISSLSWQIKCKKAEIWAEERRLASLDD